MHQNHNIPWHKISQPLKFRTNDTSYTPPRTGLFASPHSNFPDDLNHFTRIVASTIRTFSDTERAKYPHPSSLELTNLRAGLDDGAPVFRDALQTQYPEYLRDANQQLQNWKDRVHRDLTTYNGMPCKAQYTTSEADLAEVVKVLFAESTELSSPGDKGRHATTVLLALCNHPSVPLETLHHLSWGHHFGWSRVRESALRAYLLLNILYSVATRDEECVRDIWDTGAYAQIEFYRGTIKMETQGMDYSAQQIPHRRFWDEARRYTINHESPGSGRPNASKGIGIDTVWPLIHVLPVALLKDYIKLLFRILYTYDMVARECGVDPGWEEEITKRSHRYLTQ
ncbi:hypothetical protein DFP72DRAFT_1008215 [Ephemerocybe angulata]|uniref:Uncharacterized protein n=1 Tax=Ephemerocybe angulata TaxID=980116 RepID=A0A8H6I1G4_9AGAR|nr:hypothetical protein DFP72DRAFT_1008215 [Tulosesus angulatus]